MAKKYRITNYGATRILPYKGIPYEISHNSSIETDDRDIAVALSSFQFVDMEEVLVVAKAPKEVKKEQPAPVEKPVKEKVVSEKKKKVATGKSKKTKQRKIKENKNE